MLALVLEIVGVRAVFLSVVLLPSTGFLHVFYELPGVLHHEVTSLKYFGSNNAPPFLCIDVDKLHNKTKTINVYGTPCFKGCVSYFIHHDVTTVEVLGTHHALTFTFKLH